MESNLYKKIYVQLFKTAALIKSSDDYKIRQYNITIHNFVSKISILKMYIQLNHRL